MIRILREVTGTVDGFTYHPHLYYVDEKDRLVWFQVGDYSRSLDKYSKAKPFDTRYRKFEQICTVPELQDCAIVEITSENGNTYLVNTVKNTCTCRGYKFHGRCRHLYMAMKKAA